MHGPLEVQQAQEQPQLQHQQIEATQQLEQPQ